MSRIILFSLLTLSFFSSQAQTIPQTLGAPNTLVTTRGNHYVDSVLRLPKRIPGVNRIKDTASVYYQISDSTEYVWTGWQWRKTSASFDVTNGLSKSGDVGVL